ncbi:succinate dehydrogenase, hydrophobic membrane anchor protein [Marivivens sp. LCG002]|uniref:succinate dehydrogenase, hydrophobic membrane anchor protein n=1 Tax=Marivivens sp. LCG002 TaxID=3051171 RepID=UPI00255476F0|nr:succinate dehydrogenase, hydrophobic membrane anchor protein [Marivivens sp. LCG002]WIV50222.1 succinate dehydrogenase, hydrophobic membrane anchor protein [Marivivens sp. LCG002]
MRYLTARKRAEGKGASHTGTEHHWSMQVSAVGLALIVPTFLYIFGKALGSDYATVTETFSHPIPAIVTALVLIFGLKHFNRGFEMMAQDYLRGSQLKAAIMFMTAFTYGLAATGLFALAKLAL